LGALAGQGLVGDQRRNRVGALFGHQARRRKIDQIAVLDGAHTAAHRPTDGLGGVGMGEHIGRPRPRLLDDGADLVLGIAPGSHGIGRRCHAAGRHDLDLVGAQQQFLARRLAHAVGDTSQRADTHAAAQGELSAR